MKADGDTNSFSSSDSSTNEENDTSSPSVNEAVQHNIDVEETDASSLPSFKPPVGWKKIQTSNEDSKFGIVDVQNGENEIWLLKVPSRVTRIDLSGKTFRLPPGSINVPTKVAKIQKTLQETTFSSFQRKTIETAATYGVYEIAPRNNEDNGEISQSTAPHQAILDKMREFELLIPSNGGLVLSKKPDRYFNICREIELPDPASNIETILSKKPEIPQHPSESFVSRSITTSSEFTRKNLNEVADLEQKRFQRKLIEEWKYNRWHKYIKKHNKKMREAYLEWQEKCKILVKQSREKFVRELANEKFTKKKTDKKAKKRKLNSENDGVESFDNEEFLTTTDEEPSPVKKKRKKESKFGQGYYKKMLKAQYFIDPDSGDDEILTEVAEEEAEFAKLAQEQILMKEEATKSLEEAERNAAQTWTPSLVTYPKFEPPTSRWSKMNERIIKEEGEKKLKPYSIKRDWTVEERTEYYKKYNCEPPPYPVPKQMGQEIEINYVGIYGKFKTSPKLGNC
ncbi:7218_t:CDS:1 [Acaulospora morrowiae]|uniref:7218_t:CDS:1 n=1 Tax=Acaulospora morrowiae TaxID=94023 RepID=A0A9N9CWG4_9GLOM|nr:7218_t:CDS:1 [Acaulospora morrowiae]